MDKILMEKAYTSKSAEELNKITFQNFYNRLADIALNRYQWENLPETVNPRYMEIALYSTGRAVFFRDPVIGDLALKVNPTGKYDVYGDPINYQAYGYNGYTAQLSQNESVIIYNNYMRIPTFQIVRHYAWQLTEVQRALDTNAILQKMPGMIQCEDSQRLTLKNLLMKWDCNVPFIYGNKELDLSQIKYLSFDVPFVCDKLQTLKKEIWAEALTAMGVSNTNTEKNERLNVPEVELNLGGVNASRTTGLTARREAAERINKMFGLNIAVNFNPNLITGGEEEKENGSVYNNDPDDLRGNQPA